MSSSSHDNETNGGEWNLDDILNEDVEEFTEKNYIKNSEADLSDEDLEEERKESGASDDWQPPKFLTGKYMVLYGGILLILVLGGLILMLVCMNRQIDTEVKNPIKVTATPAGTQAPTNTPAPTTPDGVTATPTLRPMISANPGYIEPTKGPVDNTPTPTRRPTATATATPTPTRELQPTEPVETTPTGELTPTPDPENPVDPVVPTEPVDPVDPVDPVVPTDPVDPVEPTDPTATPEPQNETNPGTGDDN